MLSSPSQTIPSSWVRVACTHISHCASALMDELDTPHYPSSARKWVREARDDTSAMLRSISAESWPEFCQAAQTALAPIRERYSSGSFADPDGFGCVALSRFDGVLSDLAQQDPKRLEALNGEPPPPPVSFEGAPQPQRPVTLWSRLRAFFQR